MAAATAPSTRPFHVVLWGGSGFTGQLVAKHIASSYQGRIRWAIAGRDAAKLEKVRESISKINPDCKDVPILVAQPNDGSSVAKVLSQAQVVIATAGPFSKYGNMIVEQSIEQGTHYCDITGEVPWVKRNILKYNDRAKAKGVKVVHCCGYDSVPSDLGALLMVDHLRRMGKRTSKVYSLVGEARGGISGGTIFSAQTILENEGMDELRKCGTDAYYLAEAVGGARGTAKPAPPAPTFVGPADSWAAPFVMEGVNARIVHLSNALSPYGRDFCYTEVTGTGKGWAGWAKALAVTAGLAVLVLAMVPPLKAISKYFLPAPGQGPSEQAQITGRWRNHLTAISEEDTPGAPPTIIKGIVGDDRDPGYWSTARMVLESALCLALDSDKVAASGCLPSGVMTPATAMGTVLIDRLRASGFTFKVLGDSETRP